MVTEEDKKAYELIDPKLIEEKSADIMLEIVMHERAQDKEVEIFNTVKEKFTYDELVYIACIRIGLRTKEMLLENPSLVYLIKMARMQEKENNEKA